MEIKYTDYSESSLTDRKISKEIIKESLNKPDEIVEGKNGRKIAHKVIKNKLLRVIFEKQNAKTYIVITAYYTHPRRYIKWK